MSPLFNNNQELDDSEILDSFEKKASGAHKAMMISQGFNPETGYLATFVEHYEWDETTDNIALSKFPASDSERDTTKNKNVPRRLMNVKTAAINITNNHRAKTPQFILASMDII